MSRPLTRRRSLAAFLSAAALFSGHACARRPTPRPPPSAPAPAPPATTPPAAPGPTPVPAPSPAEEGPVWFQVGGRVVRQGELDAWIREDLFQRELGGISPGERWSYRRDAADRMVDELVVAAEARRRGIPPEQVLANEIEALGPVTAAELLAFFDEHRERWPAEVSFEDVAPDLQAYLESQRPRQARENLRRRAGVRFVARPPRASVDPSGPSLGPSDAPVTIVAFSDYPCAGCLRIHSSLETLLERYPGEVRVVQKHYPQEALHEQARQAAEASVCAEAQGRFWPFHERLLRHAEPLSDAELLETARELGLDEARFRRCLDDPEVRRRVQLDIEAATLAGVEAAPTLFVNGIALAGARPVEEYVRLIESELERLNP
jgi:predicted DsbA family dithiol-disulfide isomerase